MHSGAGCTQLHAPIYMRVHSSSINADANQLRYKYNCKQYSYEPNYMCIYIYRYVCKFMYIYTYISQPGTLNPRFRPFHVVAAVLPCILGSWGVPRRRVPQHSPIMALHPPKGIVMKRSPNTQGYNPKGPRVRPGTLN